ncbi:DUF1214 domain-containing protein [Phyllobacterium endophyticum]|uniref:DUF1214 domain-containing protein n=1 Tax=Phyllobacterium endophyticum TaxID=1149773 RepID=A0A2P7B217_9HYPH|nr:DUF1214 domain-containing protein [Phyllobacterium endophyticum]MBB3238103.1 hypothetical protein [Phyllobacterium endophyticum]PSH60513.1 DUF1214 domain-containing protein [Phyllobacterium endophyticum]TYR42689.1 DUF1214 domain-containing protein [Phyllobacterium endophyticum]
MLRNVLLACLALVIAVGGGTLSAWYAVNRFDGFGALTVGQWTGHPEAGTPLSDPYAKARAAREGAFPLGSAEGLAFYAYSDEQGRALDRRCSYTIKGNSPNSRFWTLYAADRSLIPLTPGMNRLPALHSRQIFRQGDGQFVVLVSPKAQPGNWLATAGAGRMVLVLTLYDTPVGSNSGLVDMTFPAIMRTGCDG